MARISLSDYARQNELTPTEATAHAVRAGYRLGMFASPIEDGSDDIDAAQADEVAAQDIGLVFVQVDAGYVPRFRIELKFKDSVVDAPRLMLALAERFDGTDIVHDADRRVWSTQVPETHRNAITGQVSVDETVASYWDF
jgi:hypothetical protein